MQMLYVMILIIDPYHSSTDLSEITVTAVSVCVFSSVPYLKLNKKHLTGSLFLIRL
jgi:hypothetical protein